ncbi:MAG TPA: XrtA system polysaccharide deacetylase [Candidatus Acidoferrum sp.]|nr:XrtA system polysaccharide deacetylase [Candidatus Acidoferrum sp.]
MKNALTVDLEDYFHVSAYSGKVRLEEWDSYPSRVAANTDRLLALLSEHNCLATVFVLGWVAEKKPEIVARVAAAGHEIACHSLLHRSVFNLTPQEFREDTHRAKAVIEDASGKQVFGYRAPSFSITKESSWALEILAEEGFQYDSSVFPVKHPAYGVPEAPRTPFWVNTASGRILEFPMPTLAIGSMRSPIGGGAYLRLLPYRYTRWAIRHLNRSENFPVCVYIHPWELDPEQPRLGGSLSTRGRHYFGLQGTEAKLRKLIRDIEFCPLGSLISEMGPMDAQQAI